MQDPPTGADPRLFDLWSRFYDFRPVQRLTYQPEHDAVLRALRGTSPRRLLDVGCGTGRLAARLQRAFPGALVVGCDFSRGMLGRAAARHPGGRLSSADAVRLPFADGCFDAVVSTQAFHWFPDQPAALAECHRVLRHGGRLLVSVVNPPLDCQGEAVRLGSRWLGEPFDWPTRRRMRELVRDAGFRGVDQRYVFRLPLPLAFPTYLTQARKPGARPADEPG